MAKGNGGTRATNSSTAHGNGNSSHPITGFTASEVMKQARINVYENYPLTQGQINQKLSEFDSRISKAEAETEKSYAEFKKVRQVAKQEDIDNDSIYYTPEYKSYRIAERKVLDLKEGKKQFEMMYGPKVEKEVKVPKVRRLSNRIK